MSCLGLLGSLNSRTPCSHECASACLGHSSRRRRARSTRTQRISLGRHLSPRLIGSINADPMTVLQPHEVGSCALKRRVRHLLRFGGWVGCSRFASRTPSVFLSFFLYLQHPLFSSLFSRENSVEIVKFWGSAEPSRLRLVWAQNQPNFRPNRQNAGNFAENPYTWNLPCDRLGILSISSILPQILPQSQTSSQTQGKSRVSRMEHQTPSVFLGNFRKRKVLGTLCFPFCLPENLLHPKLRCL